MSISMNTHSVQFGALRVREKSMEEATNKTTVKHYRMARRDYKAGIDFLDRAGLDIDIQGKMPHPEAKEKGYVTTPSVIAYLIDRDRNLRVSVHGNASDSPWSVLSGIITRGFGLIDADTMTLKDTERPLTPIYKHREGVRKPWKRDILYYVQSKLSHRGNRYDADKVMPEELK